MQNEVQLVSSSSGLLEVRLVEIQDVLIKGRTEARALRALLNTTMRIAGWFMIAVVLLTLIHSPNLHAQHAPKPFRVCINPSNGRPTYVANISSCKAWNAKSQDVTVGVQYGFDGDSYPCACVDRLPTCEPPAMFSLKQTLPPFTMLVRFHHAEMINRSPYWFFAKAGEPPTPCPANADANYKRWCAAKIGEIVYHITPAWSARWSAE